LNRILIACCWLLLIPAVSATAGEPPADPVLLEPAQQEATGFAGASANLEFRAMLIVGVRSRRDLGGEAQSLPDETGTLAIDRQGLRYRERVSGRESELLSLPLADIASVRAEATDHGYDLLFVDTSAARPDARTHLFLLPRREAVERGALAMTAKRRIQALSDAPAGAAGKPAIVKAPAAEERIVLNFPPSRITAGLEVPPTMNTERNRSGKLVEAAGLLGWGAACGPCSLGMCGPALMVGCLATYLGGGALSALSRKAAAASDKPAAIDSVPGLPRHQAQSVLDRMEAAAGQVFGASALQACAERKFPGLRDHPPAQAWKDETRSAVLSLTPTDPASNGTQPPGSPRAGYRHALGLRVSDALLVPLLNSRADGEELQILLIVQGEIELTDLEQKSSVRRTVRWHSPKLTLGEWLADDMAAITAALTRSCEGFAEQAAYESEQAWLYDTASR